jgi:hypothetical protein
MIGMMEIIRQDDYKIIPRSGSVLAKCLTRLQTILSLTYVP